MYRQAYFYFREALPQLALLIILYKVLWILKQSIWDVPKNVVHNGGFISPLKKIGMLKLLLWYFKNSTIVFILGMFLNI